VFIYTLDRQIKRGPDPEPPSDSDRNGDGKSNQDGFLNVSADRLDAGSHAEPGCERDKKGRDE
jgi:hypothetical protein